MALLEVEELSKTFGGLTALKNVTFKVEKGEFVGIIGPNGSGKTTLFNCISGFYRPTSGRVIFNGKNITGLPPHKICRLGIGRTFQIPQPFQNLTVLENIMVGAVVVEGSISKAREKAEEVLKFLEIEKFANEQAKKLNIHNRKILELAKALAVSPSILLLDEIAAGLNPVELNDLIEKIKRIQKGGITIIMIEHVMKTVMTLSKRIIVLHHGEKLSEGTPEQIANDKKTIEAYLGEKYIF